MTFRFRFEAILELRRQERDTAAAAVGQALMAIDKLESQREGLRQELQGLRRQAEQRLHGTISVDALLAHGRYDLQLQAHDQALLQTRQQLHQELSRRQDRLVEAEAEVKRFERLQERDRSAHAKELARREQFEADDAAARRYARASTGSP